MIAHADVSADRGTFGKVAKAVLFIGTLILLAGCAVDELSVVSYTSSAEVKPPQIVPTTLKSSPFPWDIVLSGISDIFTGARKKAIEEKVGYREERSFTLFRLKRAEDSGDCERKPLANSCEQGSPSANETRTVSQSDEDSDDVTTSEARK
jgi:hypothetical protein